MNEQELLARIDMEFLDFMADEGNIDNVRSAVAQLVSKYAAQQKPAKEVIPRKWVEEVDKVPSNLTRGFDYIDILGAAFSILGLSDPETQTKFIRAVANGYDIEKEKKYLLPMPETAGQVKDVWYYARLHKSGLWHESELQHDKAWASEHGYAVTQAQIDVAPAWVKALPKVEVKEDE